MIYTFVTNMEDMNVEIPYDSENISLNGLKEAMLEIERHKESIGLEDNIEYVVGYNSQDTEIERAFNQVPLTGFATVKDREDVSSLEDLEHEKIPLATVMNNYGTHMHEIRETLEDLEREEYPAVTRVYGLEAGETLEEAANHLESRSPTVELNLIGEPVNLEYRPGMASNSFEITEDLQHSDSDKANILRYQRELEQLTGKGIAYLSRKEKELKEIEAIKDYHEWDGINLEEERVEQLHLPTTDQEDYEE